MEKKKVVPIGVSIILVILLVMGIALNVYYAATSQNLFRDTAFLVRIVDGIGCIFALIYCFMGYKKNASAYFNAFCITSCLSCVLAIFAVAEGYQAGSFISALILAMHLIIFACLSILIVAKDLGKKKSYAMTVIILLCTLVNLSTLIGTSFLIFSGIIENIILKIVLFIIVYAKYKDKAARGTK